MKSTDLGNLNNTTHLGWLYGRILSEPAPQIAVSELADSSVNFVVRPWVKNEDYWAVRFDLTGKIKEAFDKNGIEIPFPQRTVHMIQEPV